jgi:hypothetical protein
MEFPTLVYKKGGVHQMNGGSYSYRSVSDDVELESALADGFVLSMAELLEPAKVEPKKVEEVAEDAPPTRSELEAKLNELGIKFDKRLGDKKLADLIESAIK